MSPVMPFPDLDRARDEAAEWIARAFRGLSADEQAALRDWSRRPENRRAMQEMSSVWQGLDVLSVLSDLFPRETAPAAPPAAPPAPVAPPRWRLAVAASLVVALAAGALFFTRRPVTARPPAAFAPLQAQAYTSTIGEHRTIRLPDGSVLALNSGTLVDVSFSPDLRAVNLHRGEAHFEVAHDTSRPFLVTANGRTVRAVGTAFNVRLRGGDALDVLVTEGVVSTYAADGTDATQGSRLVAGELLQLRDGRSDVRRLDATELDALTAWRRGVLVLDGITLEAALEEAARYTPHRIVIDDESLKSVRLGGSFRTDDLAPLLQALRTSFGIDTHEDADGTLRLTRASPRE